MKYLVFLIAMAAGVPFIALVSSLSPRLKRLAFAFMVVTFLFNSMTSINFLSMEYYRGPVRGFEVTFADLIAWGLALGMMLRTPQKIVWKPRFTIMLSLFFLYIIFSLVRAGNSKDELSLLFTNLARTGKETFRGEGYAYWSSSSYDEDRAWAQGFFTGVQGRVEKSELLVVRAIRAF